MRILMNDIPCEIRPQICGELRKIGRESVHMGYKSHHEADDYLFMVISRLINPTQEDGIRIYSVHTYNSSTKSLSNGSYCLTYGQALKEMSSRIYMPSN